MEMSIGAIKHFSAFSATTGFAVSGTHAATTLHLSWTLDRKSAAFEACCMSYSHSLQILVILRWWRFRGISNKVSCLHIQKVDDEKSNKYSFWKPYPNDLFWAQTFSFFLNPYLVLFCILK
jgi:hypothetical protein